MEKTMTEYERINHLIEALEISKKYAGEEFDYCVSQNKHSKAIYFSGLRRLLSSQISSLKDNLYVFQHSEDNKYNPDRCPICGRKTNKSANPSFGKICIYCVNKARGY